MLSAIHAVAGLAVGSFVAGIAFARTLWHKEISAGKLALKSGEGKVVKFVKDEIKKL